MFSDNDTEEVLVYVSTHAFLLDKKELCENDTPK